MSDIVTQLRARRDELAAERTEHFDIPGFPGMVAMVQALPYTRAVELVANAGSVPGTRAEVAAADALIAEATVALFFRTDSGELQPLREWLEPQITDPEITTAIGSHGGAPMRFDDRLAAVFGILADGAAKVVAGVLPNEFARVSLGRQIKDWIETAHQGLGPLTVGE